MYLSINTANHENVIISVIDHNLKIVDMACFSCKYQFQVQDKLLKEIDKICNNNKIIVNKLNGIFIVNKSKEMTSLRIGISAVNALAYSLNIPVFKEGDKCFYDNFQKNKKFIPIKPRYEINPMLKT